MGTPRQTGPAGGPLRPLLVVSCSSVMVCIVALLGRAVLESVRLLGPVNWMALGGLGVLALVAELAFYLRYWRPRRAEWNRQPCAPHAPERLDAMDMFRRFIEAGESDPSKNGLVAYLELWFQGSIPWDQIKRGNMEQLFAYGMWYRTVPELEAAGLKHLLEEMVDALEVAWRHTFPPGYTEGARFMSHLWDDLKVHYRPLAFYVMMEGCALTSWAAMRLMGFQCHRLGDTVYYTRGLGADAARLGGAPGAPAPAPILFLHGVGGLVIYLELIWQIVALAGPVIVVDIRHMGMRLSPRIPCVDEMTSEIDAILGRVGVSKVCVVGHSYGTLVASRLVKRFPQRLHQLCLIDPVCFGMYMPHLLHNFFYRRLVISASRPLQSFLDFIVHFASRDLHLSAAFSRRFYWSDIIMWPDELPRGSTVVLGAADDLVHADEVYMMLKHMCGDDITTVYNAGAFHGAFLAFPGPKRAVVGAIGRMARSAACDSGALAAHAAHDAAMPATLEGQAAEIKATGTHIDSFVDAEGHVHAEPHAHCGHDHGHGGGGGGGGAPWSDSPGSSSSDRERDARRAAAKAAASPAAPPAGRPRRGGGKDPQRAFSLTSSPSDAITAEWGSFGGASSEDDADGGPRDATAAAAAKAGGGGAAGGKGRLVRELRRLLRRGGQAAAQ
ncbi:MAG: Alpha/Beta hydrolase protein [Monoraphidium minutum]|nr:MAG: Alpha/Beta hydrolase protein [Monoraphidium minutum]